MNSGVSPQYSGSIGSGGRQLAKDMAVNLAYRWFLGYDLDEETPNHSVLSKARRVNRSGFPGGSSS
jgi:transposase